MSSTDLRPAALSDEAMARIAALEDRLGRPLVAYEVESPYATLDDEQLRVLRNAEAELGVRLIAYSGA